MIVNQVYKTLIYMGRRTDNETYPSLKRKKLGKNYRKI